MILSGGYDDKSWIKKAQQDKLYLLDFKLLNFIGSGGDFKTLPMR